MVGIPEDMIIEILLQLPVEALLRFRCVSKIWRNLIDSPNFVKSQLNLPNKPQFMMSLTVDEKLRIYYSELNSDYVENTSPNFKELTGPWIDEILSNAFNFVGHCNGLLCFACRSSFIVLNPFTRKHIQVVVPEQQGRCFWGNWGFGYDRDSNDYKVAAVAHFSVRDSDSCHCASWIYSLKCSCWKNIADFPYNIPSLFNGVFVNGALHWKVRHCKGDFPEFFLALNLGNLEYRTVPHPLDNSNCLSRLGVLHGCLCAIYPESVNAISYDLWVMKDYGSKESWTRLGRYSGHYDYTELLLVTYGNLLVRCKFESFWEEVENTTGFRIFKPLVIEPNLVCAWSVL